MTDNFFMSSVKIKFANLSNGNNNMLLAQKHKISLNARQSISLSLVGVE